MKIDRKILYIIILAMTTTIATASKKVTSMIKEENITYSVGSTVMKGYIAYNENLKGKRPAVLIVHEWWGLNDYPKTRAKQLAELGYIAMAVDMYGDGKIATNPKEAQALASTFYSNPQLSKSRLDAALAEIKKHKQTDNQNIFAIGYCFGGSVVLNSAKLGSELKGVVSFHGGLAGVPANKKLLKAMILVCNGGNDKFVSENDINTFKHQLDSIGANYTFITYPNATHAFTNPASTEVGKSFNMPIEYNKKADIDSWNDMLAFFKKTIKK
ncbi:MAG: dienelactone hydrolase family protein [Paludibacter sp.]